MNKLSNQYQVPAYSTLKNLLDKLQLFNFLNKVSDSFLNKFEDFINPYTQSVDSFTTLTIFGCPDPNADNYQEGAIENGTCAYSYDITFGLDEDNSGTIKFYILDLDGDLNLVDNDYYLETSILSYSNEFIGSELTFSRDNLPTSEFGNPKIFVKFFNSNGQEIGNGDPEINRNLTEFFGFHFYVWTNDEASCGARTRDPVIKSHMLYRLS